MKPRRETLDIQVLKRHVRRLPAVEASWATVAPEDRVAFRAEWHDLMDVFCHLVATSEAGRLGEGDNRDLREIAEDLASALPALERMRLRKPDADLLARLRLAAAS
jgi:hypothetical protein